MWFYLRREVLDYAIIELGIFMVYLRVDDCVIDSLFIVGLNNEHLGSKLAQGSKGVLQGGLVPYR